MEQIQRQALIKVHNLLITQNRPLDLEKDKDKFTDEEMESIVSMYKDKTTLKSNFIKIVREEKLKVS